MLHQCECGYKAAQEQFGEGCPACESEIPVAYCEKELTYLENKVYNFIKENTDPETMDCVDIDDLIAGVRESAKTLRGVLSSLVKKDLIEVEEYDSNFKVQNFYWMKGAFDG